MAAEHTEQFQIKGDSPVKADLMFWRIVGHEALSRPSFYELTVLSKNPKIEAKDILGHAFNVAISFPDKGGGLHQRHCQGHATRFTRQGEVGRYFRYQISLQSWFGLLSRRSNSRILQDKPVLEVLDAVLEDSPIKRVKKTKTDHVIGQHSPIRYCVQHQESDYHFLSRLLEDEGIYYWFDAHDAVGTMHLSDASDVAHDKLPVADTLNYVSGGVNTAQYNEISSWTSTRQLESGKFASRDSDFKVIRKKLIADKGDPDSHELADLEAFEFAGGYFDGEDTDNIAKLRLDELVTKRQRYWAQTSWPDVTAGKSFSFKGDPHQTSDGDYLIAACSFVVSHPGYEGVNIKEEPRPISAVLRPAILDDAVNADTGAGLLDLLERSTDLRTGVLNTRAFLLTVIPLDLPYRVPRLTPKTSMPGPQSAIVVGPEGEEIHADSFGRVKVHFHWDRYDKSNEKSTAWVRVSQPWAGKGWGGYFIPRIGQEVIVDFLNGDPNRPIIMGRVYNDDQPKPFDSHTQSGFRTRSTPKGSAANCNEFRFDDKKGSEQVYLHAEKNQDIEVENDETHWVGRDRKKTIDRDETNHIKQDRTETVDRNEKITVHGWRTEEVDLDETIKIHKNRKERVDNNETISIGDNRTEDVGKNETIKIGQNRSKTIGKNEKDQIGKNWSIKVGKMKTETIGIANIETIGMARMTNIGMAYSLNVGMLMNTIVGGMQNEQVMQNKSVNVGKNLNMTAGEEIVLKCGKSTLALRSDGTVYLNGEEINIGAAGKNTIIHGDKVFINPGVKGKTYAPSGDSASPGVGADAGGGGGNGFVAGLGSAPGTMAEMQKIMSQGAGGLGGGMFGAIKGLMGLAQQAQGLVGTAKQVGGMLGLGGKSKEAHGVGGGSSTAGSTGSTRAPSVVPPALGAPHENSEAPPQHSYIGIKPPDKSKEGHTPIFF
jgi:type VI secretion system secreted protein VgrG